MRRLRGEHGDTSLTSGPPPSRPTPQTQRYFAESSGFPFVPFQNIRDQCSDSSRSSASSPPASSSPKCAKSQRQQIVLAAHNSPGHSYDESECSLTQTSESSSSSNSMSSISVPLLSKRHVSFSTVEVREYAVTMDPKGRSRYSLTLDWQHADAYRNEIGGLDDEDSGDVTWMDIAARRERLAIMGHELTAEDVNSVLQTGRAVKFS